ncbi:hypothetical protein COLO4_37132 [Corchorus olitorius]|uniref:Uncharacterized protein n=1 Tax=Corchorus olitorius TaxID=93759 RepID=A0A1R3G377_9ROSI|nr:hypothetical protein COLO4_37132 [Corchorus olitorius]
MAPTKKDGGVSKRVLSKGAWTTEEDRKLAEYIEIHGPKRWKTIATKSEETSTSETLPQKTWETASQQMEEEVENIFDVNEFFDFSTQGCFGLEWVNKFLQLEHQDENP